jgi:hypothetical protein
MNGEGGMKRMSEVTELIQRTDRLRYHLEALRTELDRLRQDLLRFQSEQAASANGADKRTTNCFDAALALTADLGPDFSSENPHFRNSKSETRNSKQIPRSKSEIPNGFEF